MTAGYSVRAATPEDLDDIVDVVLVAMPHDPQWNYRFVYKDKFPGDHRKYTRLLYQNFISPTNDDWHVSLAETSGSQTPRKVVGFAVWDLSYANKDQKGPDYEPQNPMAMTAQMGGSTRRDVAPQRQAAFRAAGAYEKQHFFDNVYGSDQIHLQILGVHPDHWRRKIGSQLVGWGMDEARQHKVPLTLMAGSTGQHLYSNLGFRSLGTSITQAPGEEEMVDAVAMVYEPQT
ncbi:gnat family [Fusarium albosuccineum]|uniref:Gnat family n=1 Tax=Fusarium albosuccineum TaxID=1237068 RepID=A0A8H4PF05_9HYPO|nr:gnat family [Fusarium albosuccineum]